MYSLFERVDKFLLHGIFQKISDLWTDVTGYSSFRLAILVGLAYLLLLSIATVLSIMFGELSMTLVLLSGFAFAGLLLPQLFRGMLRRERDITSRAMNHLAEFWPYGLLRLAYLALVPNAIMSSWSALSTPIAWDQLLFGPCTVLWLCLMYVTACTPKPPSILKAGNSLAASSI